MPNPSLTVIANNWTQLISGTLQNALNTTASGGTVATGAAVWTATDPNGTAAFTSQEASYTGTNWTTTSGGSYTGLVGQLGGAWTVSDMNDLSCSSSAALYWFRAVIGHPGAPTTGYAAARVWFIATDCAAPRVLFAVRDIAVAARQLFVTTANAAALESSVTACAVIRTKSAVTARGAWINTNLRLSVN